MHRQLTTPSFCDATAFHSRMLVSSLPDRTYDPSPLNFTQNTLRYTRGVNQSEPRVPTAPTAPAASTVTTVLQVFRCATNPRQEHGSATENWNRRYRPLHTLCVVHLPAVALVERKYPDLQRRTRSRARKGSLKGLSSRKREARPSTFSLVATGKHTTLSIQRWDKMDLQRET